MSPFPGAAARLLAISTIPTFTLVTAATAQMAGQAAGTSPNEGGGMMGGGTAWGMGYGIGGFGGIGILVLALVVIAIAVLAFRRGRP